MHDSPARASLIDPVGPALARPPQAADKLVHLEYIDAVRCVAFLAVLTTHAAIHARFLADSYLGAGRYGVQLFFLMSAVTLLRSLSLRSKSVRGGGDAPPPASTLNFYLRRVFRIAPLFWFGIVLYFFVYGRQPSYWSPQGLGVWDYALTATFLHGWRPNSINGVVPGGWSIAVEMTFYLILPLLWRRRLTTLNAAVVCLLASVVLNVVLSGVVRRYGGGLFPADAPYLVDEFLYFWFPAQLCVFFAGFVLYHLLDSPALMRRCGEGTTPACLLALSLFALVGLVRVTGSKLLPDDLLWSLAWMLFIVTVAAGRPWLLVNRMTGFVGRISYSCYIVHFVALEVAYRLLVTLGLGRLPGAARFGFVWTLGLGLTVAGSYLTFRLIEQPGVRLGNAIIARIGRHPVPADRAASSHTTR